MIVDLPIPTAQQELDLHRIGSWDGDSPNSLRPPGREYPESSLCSHAVAFGSFVYGTRETSGGEPWLSWKTSFAPYNVCRVTSNRDGTIIACSTDAGTVALMRGIDGAVIATRRVSAEGANNCMVPAAHPSFISRIGTNHNDDALLIRVPSAKERTDFVLVSNINALRLNSKNPLQVAESARKMSIQNSLKLNCGSNQIVSTCGCFLEDGTIRVFALDSTEKIAWHDHPSPDSRGPSTMTPVSWEKSHSNSVIDFSIGFCLHELNEDASFIMFCTHQTAGITVYFMDPIQRSVTGSFQVACRSSKQRNRTNILAIAPVASVKSGVAVAVACKPSNNNQEGAIHIMQTTVVERQLQPFHQVYAIPINKSSTHLAMASIPPLDGQFYSFRFKVWQDEDTCAFKAFLSYGDSVGIIRLLIQDGRFDEADSMINKVGETLLTSEEYADFSPSEVALGRLQNLLNQGSVSNRASMTQAKQCFHRLSSGCISGNHKAGINLVEAAESLAKWASPDSSPNPPGPVEVTAALSTLSKALGEVLKILPSDRHEMFKIKKSQIDDQLLTLRYLTSTNLDAQLQSRFQGSRDPGHLFQNLVENACFEAAEGLWHSHLRQKIEPEIAVGAIVRIDAHSDPRSYLGLLEHLVLPSLTIEYELLPSIWNWCCRLADELDNSDEIDRAIWLLRSMERATNRLQLQIHRSFSSYSPFVDRPASSRKSKALLLKNSSTDSSFTSACATPTITRRSAASPAPSTQRSFAFPSVLQLGQLGKGASLIASKKDIASTGTVGSEEEEINDVQVRNKLLHATCLKAARDIGLGNRVMRLKSFSETGGMQSLATKLVRYLSTSAANHDTRCSEFQNKMEPFCKSFVIDFDASLLQYVNDLCDGKSATQESIQEAASVAQCCNAVAMKCQCVLVVLRTALLCKYAPSWLTHLSREAIEWSALDLGLRSELVEAARLLSIDGIVRNYCGADSCDLFRVDNPRHALRILDFVTRQFGRETVLQDSLDLADAFSHLNRLDGCVALCTHAIHGGCVDLCSDILEKLYSIDPVLAENTSIRVVSFCCELVDESTKGISSSLPLSRINELKENALNASSAGCAIIPMVFSRSNAIVAAASLSSTNTGIDVLQLENLKLDFLRINELQRNHSVFLSFSDLRNTVKLLNVAESLLTQVVEAYLECDWAAWKDKIGRARRACSLLAAACECPESELWCAVISTVAYPLKWNDEDERCVEFLHDVGVLGCLSSSSPIAARTVLSVAFGLCLKTVSGVRQGQNTFNEDIGRSVALVQDYCLVSCPSELLIEAQSLLTLSEMVWRVLLRGDERVGENLDIFRRKLRAQTWSPQFEPDKPKEGSWKQSSDGLLALCRVPPLYSTWYIGDGLLLPPSESITRSIKFCKEMMNTLVVSSRRRFLPLTSGGISEMARFLSHRGALAVALRLLSCSSVLIMTAGIPNISFSSIAKGIQEVIAASVERSLGGTGSGIVSATVDSNQAVSFLLSLNIKVAFKAFKNALPTALSTGDYSRVISLANIGVVAASGRKSRPTEDALKTGWGKQVKFTSQCKLYADRGVWWRFLKRLRIHFDHTKFDDDRGTHDTSLPYAQTLIVPMITSLLAMGQEKGGSSVDGIIHVLFLYADTFSFKRVKVVEAYVRYLLSYPDEDCSYDDVRFHLGEVEESVRQLSYLLQPEITRAMIFRKSLVALEKDERSFKDYDRYTLALSLYRETLLALRESNSKTKTKRKLDHQILEAELELVERRRDALAILSSVFEKEGERKRPSFPLFFLPLPSDFSQYARDVAVPTCGILGNGSSGDAKTFDPLEPLNGLLLRAQDMNVSTSLAPLCIPLGLPSGYIHARFLMDQFRLSLQENTSLPSFDHVVPVFSRIQSSADKAALGEWCSGFYMNDDEQRLQFLELAQNCAVKHSSELEQRQRRSPRKNADPGDAQEIMQALETVQRLNKATSSLSDKQIVVNALRKDSTLASIAKELLQKLDDTLWNQHDGSPTSERVVEMLLNESSSLAANRCVANAPLSMQNFQQLSAVVNDACHALANEHSHIHVGGIAWTMARSWLSQGGRSNKATDSNGGANVLPSPFHKPTTIDGINEEEDTINFVMDLGALQDDVQMWCEGIASANSKPMDDQNIIPDEEQNALIKTQREEAEQLTIRAALRVAFVLACHDFKESDTSRVDDTPSTGKSRQLTRSTGRNKTGGLLARIEQLSVKQNVYAMDCARHLLQVVFAKPEIRCESKFVAEPDRNLNTPVTFGMRHRALRSAAVLVPQEALEQVIEDEGYLAANNNCSLGKCAFGVFVASECETIGMPLAHSDLGHISTMHFSSYARTLWRHHRDGELKGSRGRLLLLLLEMTLKDEETIDAAFVELILTEMGRLNLPRTVLLASERIMALKESIGYTKYESMIAACTSTLDAAITKSVTTITSEMRRQAEQLPRWEESAAVDAAGTIYRAGQVVQHFSSTEQGQCRLGEFIERVNEITALSADNAVLMQALNETLEGAVRHVDDTSSHA